jgi:LPXTG-site transpeptidase (sortase) family protein
MVDINKTLPLPNENSDEPTTSGETEPALKLIRQKVANLYSGEPSVKEEEAEIEKLGVQSRHQEFIEQLMESGQGMAEIQTAWHNYYQSLNDKDKRQVWQEFYANHQQGSSYFTKTVAVSPTANKAVPAQPATPKQLRPTEKLSGDFSKKPADKTKPSSIATLKKYLLDTIIARGKLSKKHHLKSLLFGLGMGVLAIFIVMFGFFNERFIAPFISPSRTISNTSIIVDPTASNNVGPEPLVIIPKINVEIPVVYDVNSIEPSAMSEGLMRGVLHYPLSPVPGQNGNVVVVGHSSNNIFNKGQYKFAFVLLSRLEEGDTFMLNYNTKRYIYRVYTKKIVSPNDVSVLGSADRPATATLITCDPPGTAMNRLVVIGEQISPTTETNIAANTTSATEQPTVVPGNAESLFHRLFGWIWD